MNGCEAQYENICKGEFAAIHAKLDRLDEAIRGKTAWRRPSGHAAASSGSSPAQP